MDPYTQQKNNSGMGIRMYVGSIVLYAASIFGLMWLCNWGGGGTTCEVVFPMVSWLGGVMVLVLVLYLFFKKNWISKTYWAFYLWFVITMLYVFFAEGLR